METVQDRLNEELSKGNSIADWAIGYYLTAGNTHSPVLKISIFQFIEETQHNTKVLIDYLGSMMWINCRPENVRYGWGGKNCPSPEGKELRRKLEAIKT